MKAAFLALLLLLATSTVAQARPIKHDAYPPGMTLKVIQHESNDAYECDFSYDCASATPLFHTTTPLDAKRLSGWVETATAPRLSFVLLDNLFPTTADAQASLDDEQATTMANGFYIPKNAPAGGYFGRIKLGETILTLDVVVVGTHLIEAAEWDRKQSLSRSVITRYLLGQVAAAAVLDAP